MSVVHSSDTATPTPRRIPEAYLRAEISAFPLVDEEAFRCCLIELEPAMRSDNADKSYKTYKLWRSCEDLLASHTGWSLDRLIAARDRAWFDSNNQRQAVPLHRYLKNLARAHLVPRAGVTEIEESTELSALDAAAHYHWLTITLPEDTLLTALGVDPAPVRVDIDPPLLVRRLLDDGVAEIHLHIGAGMNFPLLWVSALAAIANPYIKDDQLASAGAPFDNGKFLVRWLLAAAIARCALAEHLVRGDDDFRAFLTEQFLLGKKTCKSPKTDDKPCGCSHCLAVDDSRVTWSVRQQAIFTQVIQALAAGDAHDLPELLELQDLYADIHPTALTFDDHPISSVEEAFHRCDPIAVRFNLHGENVGERWLMSRSLDYLNGGSDNYDKYFACIFWQTIRIRCQYYRAVVQRPLTGGLQWFIRFYARLSKLRTPIYPIQLEMAYHVAGTGHRIRAIEFRTSIANPEKDARGKIIKSAIVKIAEEVLGYLQSWQRILEHRNDSMTDPEMGIVFHFVKDRDADKDWEHGWPAAFWANTFAEPTKTNTSNIGQEGRYVSYYIEQSAKACALAELIEKVPSCLWVIRGLDVATDELGIPTWVLTPLFRHVLDTAARVSILPNKEHHYPTPLRITAHVGEDFRHLMEGMRRIYEQIHYILGNTTGRLGHAVALGVEPQSWAESVGSILMPADERLWDLVWEWRLYTHHRIKQGFAAAAPAGRIETIINQIRALSEQVYGSKTHYTVEQLAEAHHQLHRFLVPPFAPAPVVDGHFDTFKNGVKNIRDWHDHDNRQIHEHLKVSKILDAYINDEACFKRGQTLIDVPIRADEIAAIHAVQYAIRRGVAQSGIVVEVNPSSNLLIGDLLDLRNHPILRLCPPVPDPDAPPPIAIALGSDDPLTFSTQLLREYSLLYQAACAAGYPEKVVYDWLESIRHTSMDARFTRAWRPNALEKVKSLIQDLSAFLQLPNQT